MRRVNVVELKQGDLVIVTKVTAEDRRSGVIPDLLAHVKSVRKSMVEIEFQRGKRIISAPLFKDQVRKF